MAGPLAGIRILEFAGLGPGPFAAMMLADAGAEVITIERPGNKPLGSLRADAEDALARGRTRLALDLRQPAGVELALRLVEGCDALIEGNRPGIMEKLGLGPDACLARRPCLVYGRMTGWGQEGPLARAAGHDLNYIAVTGALHAIGGPEAPVPPLNLVGDFGAGGMLLAFGITAALLEARHSGRGQVVDAAMCDGTALMMAPFYAMAAAGRWRDERAANLLDGGAPWYGVYRCRDGRFVSVGALEPAFFAQLVELLGLPPQCLDERADRSAWPRLRARLEAAFAQRTRDEWCALLEGSDACFAPVLSIGEAPQHAHLRARRTFVETAAGPQPAPAPRFTRTSSVPRGSVRGDAARAVLHAAGIPQAEVGMLEEAGILRF